MAFAESETSEAFQADLNLLVLSFFLPVTEPALKNGMVHHGPLLYPQCQNLKASNPPSPEHDLLAAPIHGDSWSQHSSA